MKGTKKLKRILTVMAATATMTAMCSTTAMAVEMEGADPAGGDQVEAYASDPSVGYSEDSSAWDSSSLDSSGNSYWDSDGNSYWDPNQVLPSYPERYWGYEYPSHPSSEEKEPVPEVPLQIIEEQTEHYYVKGSSEGVTITCTGELPKLSSIYVDGEFLPSTNNYIVQSGSTVLTLMPQYLDTLPVGAHTVTMKYTYGSVDSVLNISDSVTNTQNVSTDTQNSVSNQTNNNASAGNNSTAPAVNSAPQTGDTSAVLLWSMVALASGFSCVVLKRIGSR